MERPDRSDSHLAPEEEARREEETREYFDGIAPKRHTKPSRSEYSSVYSDDLSLPSDRDSIPELNKLHYLETDQEKLVCDGSEVEEEYVETEYYKDLNRVDKQHHTTGTGFIKEKSNESSFNFTPELTVSLGHVSGHGNPATNDWIPSADVVLPVSHKPKRSDL